MHRMRIARARHPVRVVLHDRTDGTAYALAFDPPRCIAGAVASFTLVSGPAGAGEHGRSDKAAQFRPVLDTLRA